MSYQRPPNPEPPEQTSSTPDRGGDSISEAPIEHPERAETDYQTPGGDSRGDDNA